MINTVYHEINCDGYNSLNLNLCLSARRGYTVCMNHMTLTKGQLWTPAAAGKLTLRGVSGKGWATYEGDSRDFVLDTTRKFSFPSGDRVVVQAVDDLEFCFEAD